MAISFNGIKSMLPARPWLKRSVERLSRPPQAKPSPPANGSMPSNGPNGSIVVIPSPASIKELQEESRLALHAARPDLHNFVMARLVKKRSLKELVQQLRTDPEGDGRVSAAYALGGIGDPRATRALSAALASTDREVRLAAATALGQIGGEKIFQMLMRKLRSRDWAVREAAVHGLGVLGDELAFTDILMRLGEDDYWGVREMAVDALVRMNNGRAIAPVVHALKDEDPAVRTMAEWGLAHLSDERGFNTLLKYLSGGNGMRVVHGVAGALRRMGSQQAFEALLNCLINDSQEVRLAAGFALGGMRKAWVISDLKKRMKELKVNPEARDAVLALVMVNSFRVGGEVDHLQRGSQIVDFASAVAKKWKPSFEYYLRVNEARKMSWDRAFLMTADEYKDATFPVSIINGERENLAVRFDDPRAGEIIIELDPEKDIEIIVSLYPERRLKIDLQVLEGNAKSLEELEREYLEQYPGIEKLSRAAHHAAEVVSDYRKLARAIKHTRILIGMAQRGLAYYS